MFKGESERQTMAKRQNIYTREFKARLQEEQPYGRKTVVSAPKTLNEVSLKQRNEMLLAQLDDAKNTIFDLHSELLDKRVYIDSLLNNYQTEINDFIILSILFGISLGVIVFLLIK